MIDRLNFVLTFVSALGSGLIAGFFFAFSIVVMKALAHQLIANPERLRQLDVSVFAE